MVAPAFGAAGSFGAGTSSVAPGVPSGTAQNHVVLCPVFAVSTGTVGTISTPSGWTLLGTNTQAAAGGTSRTSVYRRVVPSGGITTPSFTCSGAVGMYATISRWTGVDTTTPEDVALDFAVGDSRFPTASSVTTVTGDVMAVALFSYADNWDTSSPTNGSTLAYGSSGYSSVTGSDGGQGGAYKVISAVGATGTIGVTMTQSSAQPLENWSAVMVALRPAVPPVVDYPEQWFRHAAPAHHRDELTERRLRVRRPSGLYVPACKVA